MLTELVTRDLPPGAPVAIRVFGDPAHPCGTDLAVPFGPLDPASVTGLIDGIEVFQQNDTPIGLALRSVPSDLADAAGTRIVLLITDSQETVAEPRPVRPRPDGRRARAGQDRHPRGRRGHCP